MRITVGTFAGLLALATVSVEAAPLAPNDIGLGAAPPIEQVRDDCGHGWHRTGWRDHRGHWHWGDCVPNGNPHPGWGARWDHSYPAWHGGPYWGWNSPPNWR
jgi:hypothetical protein